jgi:hypothetical protein
MEWTGYEVFSVLSGISLLGAAFVPDLRVKNRVLAAFGGLFFLVYGFYVASQTTGTWTFPTAIFVIPFGAVGYILYTFAKRKGYFGGTVDQNRRDR